MERTSAWTSKHRHITRGYEHLTASHEAIIVRAMIALMARRLAQPSHLSALAFHKGLWRAARLNGKVLLNWDDKGC